MEDAAPRRHSLQLQPTVAERCADAIAPVLRHCSPNRPSYLYWAVFTGLIARWLPRTSHCVQCGMLFPAFQQRAASLERSPGYRRFSNRAGGGFCDPRIASRRRPVRASSGPRAWRSEAVKSSMLPRAALPAGFMSELLSLAGHIEIGSFFSGIFVGTAGTVLTVAAIFVVFLQNLRGVDVDGTSMCSSGGLVMPSFFFLGAQDIFNNVREDAARSEQRFRQTGRFEEIYCGIQRSQEAALLRSLESLRERFPPTATRELVFGLARNLALSSTRLAADLYDFALHLQRCNTAGKTHGDVDLYTELWVLDEARCSVSGRKPGEGRRPWLDPDAEILLDQQSAASRTTLAEIARRPLFARVAPEILARPTYLALVRLFDVFQPAGSCGHAATQSQEYTEEEEAVIDQFLIEVIRSSVMRRVFRHVSAIVPCDLAGSWLEVLRRIWFQRGAGRPCVFEHVFLGNLCEDASGQPIAGGLHSWLKFYLEEARGTATYLGYVYNCPEAGLADNRFVSGKFVWDYEGYRLVKDQGGFFVGISPEFQLACGTAAYFETSTPERAMRYGWESWPGARGVGYTKDVVHDGNRYRRVVCLSGMVGEKEGDEDPGLSTFSGTALQLQAMPKLYTSYATFLGAEAATDDQEMQELDRIRGASELAEQLPLWLVSEGIAVQEDCELCKECARFAAARGCHSLREALVGIRAAFDFRLEDTMVATQTDDPHIRALVEDSVEVAELFLKAVEQACGEAPLTASLPGLLTELRARGRRGPRLHQPLRLLLTGRPEGAPVADIFHLLELAEREGGDGVGVKLCDRILLVRQFFQAQVADELPWVQRP